MSDHDDAMLPGEDETVDLDAELQALLADPSMWEQPASDLGDRVVAAVRSEAVLDAPTPITRGATQRRGWLRPAIIGAAASLVALFGGIVVLSAVSSVEDNETFATELISTGRIDDVSGDVTLTALDSGLRIDLDAPGLPRRDNGSYYEGWLKTTDDVLVPVGTFHEGDDVVLWAGIGLDEVVAFSITLENLASADPAEQASSGKAVFATPIGG